jgi:catechol 2,3-dioxygenase-like lactoylglutathione lyase family enzyme
MRGKDRQRRGQASDTDMETEFSLIGSARVFAVTIDCPEPEALAQFYRDFLGGELRSTNSDLVVLAGLDGVRLDFQRVANPRPLPWPSADASSRLHLDVVVEDFEDAEERLLALGATLSDHQPGADRFRVFVDPAGHPFCIVTGDFVPTQLAR